MSEPAESKAYSRMVLILLTLLQTSVSLVVTATGILAPIIIQDLPISKSQIGFYGSIANIGQGFTSVGFGRIMDKGLNQSLVLFCLLCAGLTAVLVSFCNNMLLFVLLLLFIGIWCAISTPYGGKALPGWFASGHLNLALSVRQTGIPAGSLLGSVLLTYIAIRSSWRWAIRFSGVLLIMMGFFHFFMYRRITNKKTPPFVSAAKGAASWEFIRKKSFWTAIGSSIIYMGIQFTLIVYYSIFLQDTVHLTLALASLCLAVSQIGGITGRILYGWISDTFLEGRQSGILIFVGLLIIITTTMFCFFNPLTPLFLCLALSFLFGVSAIGWNGIFMALVINIAKERGSGAAIGVFMAACQLGPLLFPPTFGYILDQSGSYRLSFMFCALSTIIAVVLLVFHAWFLLHEEPVKG